MEAMRVPIAGHTTTSMFRRHNITDDRDITEALAKTQLYVRSLPKKRTVLPFQKSSKEAAKRVWAQCAKKRTFQAHAPVCFRADLHQHNPHMIQRLGSIFVNEGTGSDGCLEQYLADFASAVKKAQQTPFLRGEGSRGWRASFDWFVANQVNIYAVLEGKYDGPAAVPTNGNGGNHAIGSPDFDCEPGGTSTRRTSRGDLIYRPRQ